MDKIYANIATIPERKEMLKQVIDSVIKQVDDLYINANNYELGEIPYFIYDRMLKHEPHNNILYYVRQNQMGDGEKFYSIKHQSGYIFTMDDDLLYPPDYVETMIKHIERHKRKAIITLHGRTFGRHPIVSYYRGRKKGYHWNNNQDCDILVDSGGTGVMAWHSDTIKVNYDDIKHPNMGDVWMAVFARRANVPIMCVNHKSDWLKYIGPDDDFDKPKTIYAEHYNNDTLQTKIYNDGK